MTRAIKNTLEQNTNMHFTRKSASFCHPFSSHFQQSNLPNCALASQIEGDTSYCKGRDGGVDVVSNKSEVTVLPPLIAHVHALGSPIDFYGEPWYRRHTLFGMSKLLLPYRFECQDSGENPGSLPDVPSRLILRRAASFLNLVRTSPLTYAPFATFRCYD